MRGGTNPGAPKGIHNAWKHGRRAEAATDAVAYPKVLAACMAVAGAPASDRVNIGGRVIRCLRYATLRRLED